MNRSGNWTLLLLHLVAVALLLVACGRRSGQERAVAPAAPTSPPAVSTSAARSIPAAAAPTAPPGQLAAQPQAAAAPGQLSDRIGVYDPINYHDQRLTFPELSMARSIGIGWVRADLPWPEIEPKQGQFTWQVPDAFVSQAHDQGLQLLLILHSVPSWASAGAAGPGGAHRSLPRDYQAWGNYVSQTVSRYKGSVQAWEIWNEPDLAGNWLGTPGDYAQLLAVAYQAVKRADPSAQVLFAGLALNFGSANENPQFFQQALSDPRFPAAQFFDVANFHSYGPTSDADKRLALVRAALQQAGVADRPIWITETGYSSDPGSQRLPGFPKGPDGQVQYVRTVVPYLLQQPGVAKVFWYELYDYIATAGSFKNYGLLDGQLHPRPAWDALRDVIAAQH